MNPIVAIRSVSRWTQARLAAAAGTSQPTIAAYEAGTKSPTWRTVEAVAEAAGLACYPAVGTPMTREELQSHALHFAIAAKLSADPDAVIRRCRRNIARMRDVNPHAARLLDEWDRILDRPVREIVARMLDPGEHARELRHVSPFAGLLSARERAAVLRSARDAA
ncbi:MAG: helix-turn-helix transcriptional regulator [Acidimicrobiales bacterium]